MRRTLVTIVLAAILGTMVGCFTASTPPPVIEPPSGDADKEHTLDYWGKVREVMRLKTTSSDMRQVAAIIQRQSDTIRQLPIEKVDKDLYVAALSIAQCQDKELKAADAAGYSPSTLRADPELRKTYGDAGQQVAAAIGRLKALAPILSARWGMPFPPMDDPK